ncbi:transglutaminase domain-containing protein [[Clostridium] polysaccharolyticum]|uniref:Transglutaminase-like superfamily protein n=1 Tax=[Clostridium] polysaccharolyticum TaxID=29364 RepID=A0A1I0EAY3_9FIRM|nr:transglutaminase domain-containing protein [[Clostridium] polysaccharolyticum]SET42035.1 Transglutaminase-like superfamily protein [[Clostridium] polysaccharolyticum]
MKRICFYIVCMFAVFFLILLYTGEIDFSSIAQSIHIVPSKEDAVQVVYDAIKTGETTKAVSYIGKRQRISAYASELVKEAFKIDDPVTSDDFDYMLNKYRGYTAYIKGFGIYTIHYEFEYSETAAQTKWVNQKVQQILKKLKLEDKSEYEKVKKIHDYIIEHTSYDLTVKFNSAYEGLRSNATACQGYANMAYKMFTEAGLDCRVITGVGNGISHAWNIVKIKDMWYNIDCTWDDPVGGGSRNNHYDFFLKSENDFGKHERDEEYRTIEFNEKYNMTEHSWK